VGLEGFGEREHGIADAVLLLAVVCLALMTWSFLADVAGVPLWKPFASTAVTGLFALAALTRHPCWAASIRFLTGGWVVAAPYLLKFADIAPALQAYLAIGTLLVIMSIPGVAAAGARRAHVAV
jgi:hypothetical protein